MRRRLALALAGFAWIPAAAAAVAPPPVAAPKPASAEALDLARVTLPRDALVAAAEAQFRFAFKRGMGEQMALEAASPGVGAELLEVAAAAIRPYIARGYDDQVGRFAALYAAHLTPAEARELATFYRSPLGAKILAAKFAALGGVPLPETMVAGETPTSAGDITALNQSISRGMASTFTAQEQAQLMALMARPLFSRMKALVPLVAELEAEIANEADPDAEQAVGAAIAAVLKRRGLAD